MQLKKPVYLQTGHHGSISGLICMWVTRFGPNMGQIGPKWDKFGTFSDQISVRFGARLRKL